MDWLKPFSISALAHLFIIVIIFSFPFKKPQVIESILVDFTMINSHYGIDKKNITDNSAREGIITRGRSQEEKNKGYTAEAPADDKSLSSNRKTEAPDSHRDVVSINPILDKNLHDGDKHSINQKRIKDVYGAQGYGSSGKGGWSNPSGGKEMGSTGGNPADYTYVRDEIMRNIIYPEKARRMGWEGKVVISFVISEAGFVNDIKILKSSGYPLLDDAAKEALTKINSFKNRTARLVVHLPVEFRLK